VDVVLNSLAGEFMVKSLSSLAPFGRFLEIGKRDIYQEGQINLQPFRKGLAFFSVNLDPQLPTFRSILLEVVRAFEDGTFSPLPYKVFPITEVKQAFDYMVQAKHTGKIVITLQDQEVSTAPALDQAAGAHRPKESQAVSSTRGQETGLTLINLEDGILSKEGAEVFKRALGSSLSQVIVSTRELRERIEEQSSLGADFLLKGMEEFSLPAVKQHPRPALENEYVAPRSESERMFADIWQKILGIDRVGIHDNFFDLGGASLQSLQVVGKAKEAGIEIVPELLFECQTIAEVVEALSDDTHTDQGE
jgi:acyl carrier protein